MRTDNKIYLIMHSIENLQERIDKLFITTEDNFFNKSLNQEPKELYAPIQYAISQKGKRIRPLLTLMGADLFEGNLLLAEYPAYSIEILHNFTLLHDDIMDNSPLRRGVETVYKKFGTNSAILSGDTMFALSNYYIINSAEFDKLSTSEQRIELLKELNRASVEVCQGQSMDMSFETRDNVSIDEYIEMIRLKTSVLLATSLKMGGICAGASKQDLELLYQFGEYIGIAFQLQDDILDCWSNLEEFGKVTGTDIADNKKTFLYLKALELASPEDRKELIDLYSKPIEKEYKETRVREIYEKLDIRRISKDLMKEYNDKAKESLEKISVKDENKTNLIKFADKLMHRNK